MKKVASGLFAILALAVTNTRGVAQDFAAVLEPDCGYVCVFADSVTVGAVERGPEHSASPQLERRVSEESAISSNSNAEFGITVFSRH